MSDVIVTSLANLKNEVSYGNYHTLITDEPVEDGGEDAGPDPYTLLLAALGSCISMTTKLYAKRKDWPLERVTVRLRQQRIHAADCVACTKYNQAIRNFVCRVESSIGSLPLAVLYPRVIRVNPRPIKQMGFQSTLIESPNWSGRRDSNSGPHPPQGCALPGCATSRKTAPSISAKNS